MCYAKEEFTVNVTKEEVVAAVLPMQEHWLPMSNLDLLLPHMDVTVIFCYKNPTPMSISSLTIGGTKNSFGSMVGCLKSSLAQALVSYYAFAGEVVTNSMGEPELLCNNRGVDFVEAVADVDLHSLNLYTPDDTVQGKLVPTKKHSVLAIQATRFKCGGLVVACTFDHRIADAYSANLFLVSWAEIAHPNRPMTSTQPCFRRSLLVPRHPPSIHPSLDQMYIPIPDLTPPPEPKPESDPLTSRIYYVTSEQLSHMQSLATSSVGAKRTKFESFSAFLWKMVGGATAAQGKEKVVAKMGVAVDGRKRLSNGDKNKEAIMGSYIGNVLSIPYSGIVAEELVEKPLSWAAEHVHEFLKTVVTEEHFQGLIDWVEAHRPTSGLPRVCCGGTAEEGPDFLVSSGQRFPGSKVDFGWGKPVFASYYFPMDGNTGYVMPLPSPKDNGDWLIYMHLPESHLHFMESKAPLFFRPFSWDYLLN